MRLTRNGEGCFRMKIVARPRFKIPRAQRKQEVEKP